MPQSEPIAVLLINEHAEEVKVVTISLRGFYPDVRIEVAYSAEEANRMTQVSASSCVLVIIDEASLPQAPSTYVTDLRRRHPDASIILQSSRTDSAAALEALQGGVDLFLYKHSPAFLTELLFCTREAIDKRDRRLAQEQAEIRRSWLIESLGEVLYELDAGGRFLSLSRNLQTVLGYMPEDLIGRPYSTVFSEAQAQVARFRFNERRAGGRAVRAFELTLQRKTPAEGLLQMPASVTARGLYDRSGRFLGTLGLIRDLSDWRKNQETQQELLRQRQRADELETLIRQMTELSRGLEQPLSRLLRESQQLADSVREARILDRLEALTGHAAASRELVQRLTHLARPAGTAHIVNRLLDEALQSASQMARAVRFASDFTSPLPEYAGDREATAGFFQQLLAYAETYLSTVGRPRILSITTSAGGPIDSPDAPTLFPLSPSTHIHLDITETKAVIPTGDVVTSLAESLDVLSLYRLAAALGATLDISAPPVGPFRMIVRLPTGSSTALPQAHDPTAPAARHIDEARPPALPKPVGTPAVASGSERRSDMRVETALPAKVTRGSSTWDGIVMNLSVAGAGLRMSGDFPSMEMQEAAISVTTAIARLELSGLIHTRSLSAADPRRSTASGAALIVQFRGANQTETAVLASLIAAARERSLDFSVDVRIPMRSGVDEAAPQPAFDRPEDERRETVRILTALPARLEVSQQQERASRLPAQVINLSRSGACLWVRERPEAIETSVHIHFPPAHPSEPGSHEPGAPDAVLAAHIIWATADPAAPSAFHAHEHAGATRAGLRFEPLTPYAERELNRVIRQHLRAQRSGEAFPTPGPVISVQRECRNARGQAIAIIDDHVTDLADLNRPVIIVAPGYGQTALDYTALAYYLAGHHFRILRYDPTNHLGNSDGELQQTTMRSMQHDLEKVIEFVRHTWPQAPVVVITGDLAARAALKTAAQARPFDLLLLINPTTDVASMLMTVHGHDLIADYQFGLRRGVCNLLGLNVNLDQFIGDLIAGRFADLESTLEDLRVIRTPLCIATSPSDAAALPPADLPHAFMTALGTQSRLVNISSPMTDHHLDVRDPAPAAFRQLHKQIVAVLSAEPVTSTQAFPAQSYVARQRRIEQEYTFLRHDGSQINREALSAAHVAQLPHLGNLHEYRKLLDDLYGLMSPLEPGAVLVDASIGQSDLTRAVVVNHTYRAGQAAWTDRPSPLMVGVGRSRDRVGQARHAVFVLQRELATGFVGRPSAMPPLANGWLQADWMNALPFKTGSVNRLVCNLSLPYVPSPFAALKEWHRALHQDGCLIVTTFHPNTDLSPLYRRHLRQANEDEFSAQAQPLLQYLGRLREAIRHGILHTFDEATLAALLRQCGIASFRILPIFDGQALVAIVGKQNSSSRAR